MRRKTGGIYDAERLYSFHRLGGRYDASRQETQVLVIHPAGVVGCDNSNAGVHLALVTVVQSQRPNGNQNGELKNHSVIAIVSVTSSKRIRQICCTQLCEA